MKNLASPLRLLFLMCSLSLFTSQSSQAGPPFLTDDPVPVDFKHWEYYISTINNFQSHSWTGTSPHFEVNYGLMPNVQIHLLLPMNYVYNRNYGAKLGYASTEFGVKFRFIQESDNVPQIGTFPIVEIPTVKNSTFGNDKTQIFIPIWAQKSWGKLTAYGGAGYWINPGAGNKNWFFSGCEVQYDFSSHITLGGELYYHSADTNSSSSVLAFNLGGFVNFTERFHLIYSFGQSFEGNSSFNSYIGLLWTI